MNEPTPSEWVQQALFGLDELSAAYHEGGADGHGLTVTEFREHRDSIRAHLLSAAAALAVVPAHTPGVLDVDALRSPRNSLGKLALPKGLMERAVEAAWDGATSPVGDPADGIEMHSLADLADGICDFLAENAAPQARDGASRIAAERRRQIEQERWTAEHDDEKMGGSLALAAMSYALPPERRVSSGPPETWPWDEADWKPGNRIRELEKAGALIAAEIDRWLRAYEAASPSEETR